MDLSGIIFSTGKQPEQVVRVKVSAGFVLDTRDPWGEIGDLGPHTIVSSSLFEKNPGRPKL